MKATQASVTVTVALASCVLALSACAGVDGADGEAGVEGQAGPVGATGPMGEPGDTGAAGAAGDTGQPGVPGETGDTGDTGPTGATGPTGDAGQRGGSGIPGGGQDCPVTPALMVVSVAGVEAPLTTHLAASVVVTVHDASGAAIDDVDITFAGDGGLMFAPVDGMPGTFETVPTHAGQFSYVAVATDGCVLASRAFQVQVEPFKAFVSLVHVSANAPAGVRASWSTATDNQRLTLGYEAASTYVAVNHPDVSLALIDAATQLAVALPVSLSVTHGSATTAVLYDDAGAAHVGLIEDDLSPVDGIPMAARLNAFNGFEGSTALSIATAGGSVIAGLNAIALGDAGGGALLSAPAARNLTLEVDDDPSPDYAVTLPPVAEGVSTTLIVYQAGEDVRGLARTAVPPLWDPDVTSSVVTAEILYGPPDFEIVVNGLGRFIADGTGSGSDPPGVTEELFMLNSPCAIRALQLQANVSHGFPGDLNFFLTDPSRTLTHELGPTLEGDDDLVMNDVVFDIDVAFEGVEAQGSWILTIWDTFLSDTGTLHSYVVRFWCQGT